MLQHLAECYIVWNTGGFGILVVYSRIVDFSRNITAPLMIQDSVYSSRVGHCQ